MLKTIKGQLMLIVFAIVVSSFFISGVIGYYFISGDFNQHIKKDNEVFAGALANSINQFIQTTYNVTEDLALSPDIAGAPPERQKKLLEDTAKRFPYFDLLYVQNLTGMQTARSSGTPGNRGDRWWFKQFMAKPQPFVSKSYYSLAGNTTVTSVYFGVYVNGQLQGIMGSDIKLDALQKMIEDFSSSQDYYAYVLDGEGVVIAHPDKNQVIELNNYKTLKKTLLVKDAQGNALKDEKGNQKTEEKDIRVPDGLRVITEKVMQGQSGVAEYQDLEGNTLISAYASIPLPGKSDPWSIITVQKKDRAMAMITNASWKNALIAGLIALLALLFIYIFAKRLTAPITRMVTATKELAQGNLAIEELPVTTQDEVGQLGESLNTMAASLRHIVTQVSQTGEMVASSSEELTSSCEETNQAVAHVAESVEAIVFKTQSHNATVAQTSQAVEQLSAGIRLVADNASKVNEVTVQTAAAALEGRKTVDQAIEQMSHIDKSNAQVLTTVDKLADSSQHINDIVNVIAGIAAQTNLLALNAAIEAARAGEQGRGFAVVADEVRKLAEQSQEAAKQITQLINENHTNINMAVNAMNAGSGDVKQGIASVNAAGQTFSTITGQIDLLSAQVAEISQAIQNMAGNSQHIVDNMQSVDTIFKETSDHLHNVSAVTEEQSAAMSEVSRASQSLSKLAQHLSELVSRFSI
ncbi:MAG TPA: methyl-accepting chemotaxis protein [Patescibacteria group bacterium]|nr:methyl-accepting chemotaxis protein [Patescibacteria group bacterium]